MKHDTGQRIWDKGRIDGSLDLLSTVQREQIFEADREIETKNEPLTGGMRIKVVLRNTGTCNDGCADDHGHLTPVQLAALWARVGVEDDPEDLRRIPEYCSEAV